MTELFDKVMEHVFGEEGGWSDHPDDTGGKTMLGITLKTLKTARPDQNVTAETLRNLTVADAKEVYREHYWTPVKALGLPSGLSTMMFDFCVNAGFPRSVKTLQKSIGTKADGAFGPKSKAALQNKIDTVGEIEVLNEYAYQRASFYYRLWNFFRFGKGWTRRVMKTRSFATQVALQTANSGSNVSET